MARPSTAFTTSHPPRVVSNWPWPNDGGSSLSSYLTSKVYIPGGSRKLTTSDPQYQQIMRLYSWNYVIDNLGTTPCDWRVRFFGTNDNTKLFNTSGAVEPAWKSGMYYTIKPTTRSCAGSPSRRTPSRSSFRAGRVKYYGSIPTAITGTWPSYGSTDQRFWVEFIDHVLGFRQTSAGVLPGHQRHGRLRQRFHLGDPGPSLVLRSATQYMSYTDNPHPP